MLLFRYIVIYYINLFSATLSDARAVNISSTWFLPTEKFPLFYRFFRDKVTWDEASDTCGSHSGSLLTLDDERKADSLRGYLKELDTFNHIWLGLKKEVKSNTFLWINGKAIAGDGYWSEPIPISNRRLCAAIDPASDFRWISYYCGGPQTASFMCELEAPKWARESCLITRLPSVSITLEPETGVVQLVSDCGLAGTRRIACKGGTNREDLIKHLSCSEDPFTDSSITDRASYNSSPPHTGTTVRYNFKQTTRSSGWTQTRQTRH